MNKPKQEKAKAKSYTYDWYEFVIWFNYEKCKKLMYDVVVSLREKKQS